MRGRHTAAAAGTGLVLGALAVGPGLAPGFVLSYDMVFVPHPVFSRATFGLTGMLPRHVPSDAVVTALSHLAPADLVQKAILLAIFVLACASASTLVPSERLLPRLAAGVVYAWNPFVAERLLLGQWALLLGYAGLPLVVTAAARGDHRRLALALLPAAVGGFAALAVSGLVALTVGWRGARSLLATAAVLLLVALPWLVPSLLRVSSAPADAAGVAAFAARADTPFGALGSLLLLGGAWNAETVPGGYGGLLTALIWLLVVAVAVVAYARGDRIRGLVVAAAAGLVLASLGVVAPGVLRGAIGLWSGFALLRDGQQFVAPLAVLVAAGAGMAVGRLPGWVAPALLLPLLLLPGLAWGAGGRLRAVHYPADWARARTVVAADPGDVLVLPWEAYRGYPWNGERRVLDPLPRFLPGRVIVNDGVRVAVPGGRAIDLAAEDPRARELDALVRSGAPLTAALAAHGVRYVAIDAGAPDSRLAGAERVVSGPDLALYRLPGAVQAHEAHPAQLPVYIAWFITFVTFIWSVRVPTSNLVETSPPEES
ncbi:hypothetical protein GCM10027176_33090 [Actinoallomurus bryophytorum]|uniref:Transmembrane protein n=1 Tax=Actinoallomurus bryophytorum TaxID=1490222 RepID=A0A543CNF4_9ACTN|nr:hypothetical protein [Actinoallomurus bryophytorum]TQL98490.1 hypothetical protein FB559_4116 [Actinoallomurus bryophytorum]